jgi:hypothetical protein
MRIDRDTILCLLIGGLGGLALLATMLFAIVPKMAGMP